ncbi:MAG: Malonyl CoA-acyl carrier protein transacylase [candidate division CPR2 bacterium GW2011_GWC2_39_10]|uniref:Malonyl CoA-acyl carrier protein transacylase n=1 Tax=candidate division CPR2 bacterium GW2011_GWC2_39_10 TaxID=1618345 RepID=A0A0G0P535_UNCC2|nr:MAG: Malonyl CoA-acyl carrier protein transacylase [candidate division CPR2 bacterium GW2011_GWC2_39_10]
MEERDVLKGVGYIFPGQASQKVGMGEDLLNAFPAYSAKFHELNAASSKDLLGLCLKGPEEALNDTVNTQPCIYAVSVSIYHVLKEMGLGIPQAVAGHSLGEYSALNGAGVFGYVQGLRYVQYRADFMKDAAEKNPGVMYAISKPNFDVLWNIFSIISGKGVIKIANYNSPKQVVVAMQATLEEKALQLLREAGRIIKLPVNGAFHTSLMTEANSKLYNAHFNQSAFGYPHCQVYSNYDGSPSKDPLLIGSKLINQMPSSVRWVDTINNMYNDGVRTYVEVGPGNVLANLMKHFDLPDVTVLSTRNVEGLNQVIEHLQTIKKVVMY